MTIGAEDVLIETRGALGLVTLNRVAALNALNLSMIEKIAAALDAFEVNGSVRAVLVVSACEKAFCAGGDIRAVTSCAVEDGAEVFRAEYRLNARIAAYPKPYISVVDGICFGGGVGLSAHGAHCLATKRALFAMPEMAIGLFPDVGVVHRLAQVEDAGLVEWFVLTGARIGRDEAHRLGLCSAQIEAGDVARLIDAFTDGGHIEDMDFVRPFADAGDPFGERRGEISGAFAALEVEDILARLAVQKTEWAREQARILEAGCPLSLRMALWHLRHARATSETLPAVLERDYRLACFCLRNGNFREGVRAMLIDRDRSPRWLPAALSAVEDEDFISAAPIGGQLFDCGC